VRRVEYQYTCNAERLAGFMNQQAEYETGNGCNNFRDKDEIPVTDINEAIILETTVGRVGVCGFWGAGQGITTRNGCSIPRSYNAAMRPKNCAIQPVADSPDG